MSDDRVNEIYRKLAGMIDKEDIVGMAITPAFLRLLSLQFTPEEARLALHVHLTGAKIDELAEKTGMSKEKLKDMLLTMADKGTVRYNVQEDDPVFCVLGTAAGGLTETGLWANIKYPFTIQLAEALHQVVKDYSEEKLCKLGFPFAPVWAPIDALPEDAQPSENLAEVLKEAGHWSVSACPCRLSHWIVDPGNHCDHILETCMHSGDLSRWAVKHGLARELTYEEMVDLLKQCNRDGLVHTLDINSIVCNCCNDCCGIFYAYKLGAPTFIPSPFMAHVDESECNACGNCEERCPVGAITIDDVASINQDICLGCGVCVPSCTTKSMKLVRRVPAG
ncbi:MAG: 4Fe-4S binding protein [Chloroflexota bacterium]|nr:4Fe-4S binding protein [Chloroflexota bacterium]